MLLLVVGDATSTAQPLATRLLRQMPGLRVLHASDAGDALKRLADDAQEGVGGAPDLVLLGLPAADDAEDADGERVGPPRGLEALEVLRRDPSGRRAPVIAVGGSAPPTWLEAAYRGHANGYVVLPDDPEDVDRLADSIAAYWLGWNQRSRQI